MFPIDFFWRSVVKSGSAPAVISAEGARTYNELSEAVRAYAADIVRLDTTASNRVAIGAANTIEHLISLLACFAAGKTWIPLNPRNGTPELIRIVQFAEPGLVLGDDEIAARLAPAGISVVVMSELGSGNPAGTGLPMGIDSLADIDAQTPQAIKFTGGTTGTPKGVIQSVRTWNTNIVTQVHELGLCAQDRFLIAAPLTHGAGTYVMPLLAAGAALVFPHYPNAEKMLDAIEQHGVTIFFAPSTLIMKMVEEQRSSPRDVSSLRYVIYGGAPMRPEHIRQAQDIFGPVICTTYGQTEAPTVITMLRPDEMTEERLTSVGRATCLTKVAIIDPEGRPLPAGEVGEVAVRGDLLMGGYLKAPEETARTIINGWLHTGDSGLLDDQGYLFLRDRLRDVIITGGFNVYPSDVETVLCSHPSVIDSAVVGIPDEKWGEAVYAAVEVKAGVQLSSDELTALVREQLGPVKTPKKVLFFESLPRSAVAKVLKNKVRQDILERLG